MQRSMPVILAGGLVLPLICGPERLDYRSSPRSRITRRNPISACDMRGRIRQQTGIRLRSSSSGRRANSSERAYRRGIGGRTTGSPSGSAVARAGGSGCTGGRPVTAGGRAGAPVACAGGYEDLGLRTGAAAGRGGSADTLGRKLCSGALVSDGLVSAGLISAVLAALREICSWLALICSILALSCSIC